MEKKQNKYFDGTKNMRKKIYVTVMVQFAADGHILRLAVVGKIKDPHCFRLITDGKPLFTYTSKMIFLIET